MVSNTLQKYLKNKTSSLKPLDLFHEAVKRIPAYKNFLKKHKVNPSNIKTMKDFVKIPQMTKENYILAYDFKSRTWDGDTRNEHMISTSSGTMGEPTFWPRDIQTVVEGAMYHEMIFDQCFGMKKKRTLFINGFALGNWIAGTFTSECCFLVSLKGFPLTSALEVGFRGIVNIALTLETSKKDNHSGLYGGIMPNAATELALLLGMIFNENSMEERIAIKGFYDNVTEPTVDDIKANELIPFSDEDFKETSGAKTHFARNGWNIYTQMGFAPSLEITGIQSGYTGIGFRNSIPGSATVKMNLRLVHNQKPEDIAEKFKVFVEENLPEYCTYVLDATESCPPVHIPTEGPLFEKAIELMEDIYGRTVIKKFCGATIPIAVLFEELLKIPQLYIPMANEDCNMHGADENFDIELVKKGLSFATKFLS